MKTKMENQKAAAAISKSLVLNKDVPYSLENVPLLKRKRKFSAANAKVSTDQSLIHATPRLRDIRPTDAPQKDSNEEEHLQSQRCMVLHRKAHKFLGGTAHWVYSCTCNQSQADLFGAFASAINMDYKCFIEAYPDCLHKDVIKTILERFDVENQILPVVNCDHSYNLTAEHQPKINEGVYELPWDECSFAVQNTTSIGILTRQGQAVICSTCKVENCDHLKFLNEVEETELPKGISKLLDPATEQTGSNRCDSPVVSHKPIPFKFPEDLQKVYANSIQHRLPQILSPGLEGVCDQCGSNWSNNTVPAYPKSIRVVGKKTISTVHVHSRPCSHCPNMLLYDGKEHCLLHAPNLLISYEVLLDFMDLFTRNRTTMFSYYSALGDSHARCGGDLKSAMSISKFREGWYGFMRLMKPLLDLDKGFVCTKCGPEPEVVIMDGTSLAFRRSLAAWKQFLTDSKLQQPLSSENIRRHKDRVYIADKEMQALIKKYSRLSETFTDEDRHQLQEGLFASRSSLLPLLLELWDRGHTDHCPEGFCRFLRALSTNSSLCGFIHPTTDVSTILTLVIGSEDISNDPTLLQRLQEQVPAIFQVVKSGLFTPNVKILIKDLLVKAFLPFDDSGAYENSGRCSVVDSKSFYPNLPEHRSRLTYLADKERASASCQKKGRGHPSLLPGIFCLFCQHGICYGFEIMDSCESPNIPFTTLLTRFTKAPSVIIYDNACNLHNYCLNRSPNFFKESWFLVDRLHWFNHKGCSEGYCLDVYPQYKALNSQAAEQANSSLGKLKAMLSYMTHENFMNHCSFYLWVMNGRKIVS